MQAGSNDENNWQTKISLECPFKCLQIDRDVRSTLGMLNVKQIFLPLIRGSEVRRVQLMNATRGTSLRGVENNVVIYCHCLVKSYR